jgi:hypothetical protein
LQRSLEDERQARQMQEAWLGGISGASPEPLIIVDAGLRLLQTNAAARQRFGEWAPGTSLIAFCQSRMLEDVALKAATRSGEVEQVVEIRDQPYRVRALATGAGCTGVGGCVGVRRLSARSQDW